MPFDILSRLSYRGEDFLWARDIMGSNFLGVEEAVERAGANPSRKELDSLAVPLKEDVLVEARDTHVLVAELQFSIMDLREGTKRKGAEGKTLFWDQNWYFRERFAKDRGRAGWILVKKAPVSGSFDKPLGKQRSILAAYEDIASTRLVTYASILHYLVNGEKLFERAYVRCSDEYKKVRTVIAGMFGHDGFRIINHWRDYHDSSLGLGAVRDPVDHR